MTAVPRSLNINEEICHGSASHCISLGGFVYPLCLFYAAVWMVDKGKTAAKADVHYVAVSRATLYIVGIAFVLIFIVSKHCRLSRFMPFVFADEGEG